MKRKGATKQNQDEVVVSDVDSEEEVVEQEEKPKKKPLRKAKQSIKEPDEKEEKQGLNWSAIAIMLLFAIPMLITGAMQVIDIMYPEAAKTRQIRQRVMRCYEAANPSKVSEVDNFIMKYEGREHVLFAKLRGKYEKVTECQFR